MTKGDIVLVLPQPSGPDLNIPYLDCSVVRPAFVILALSRLSCFLRYKIVFLATI